MRPAARGPTVLALVLATAAADAVAHPLAPSLLGLAERPDGVVEVLWRRPAIRPVGEDLVPVLPAHCRPTGEPTVTATADGSAFEERWLVGCGDRGLVGQLVAVRGLGSRTTNVVLEVALADGSTARGLLHEGHDSFVVPAAQGWTTVAGSYFRLGIEHLLSGADHVLFVLGLVLLLGARRSLIWAVTAFTLGHSLSLSLAVLGVLEVPSAPVELAIAATIVVLALDVVRSRTGRTPGIVARWPAAVCTAFGLLHGLGFAGALRHAGLPEHAIPLSLASFNVGIEVGQLAIVGVALGVGRLLRGRVAAARTAARLAPAYVIGSLAAFWVLDRGFDALAGLLR